MQTNQTARTQMNGVAFCLVGIPPHSGTEAKGRRHGMGSSSENRRRPLSSGEVEGMLWQGPRTLFLQKNSQGFGFTLRHFIVYPPESSLHSLKETECSQDKENSNTTGKAGCQRSRLEPMDTIFVKSVKEDGPAQQAGLCKGDRLVKVNGESVLGKTYSEVIALIQNSENILELSIMPKDEDVLQLAYSQDAYLKGNEPCTDEAYNLPEPPPLCYPSTKTCSTTPQLSPPSSSKPTSGRPGGPEESSSHFTPSRRHRGRSSSAISALDFHFANHNIAIASATLPPPWKGSLPSSAHPHTNALCHQALSDWYYGQAKAAEHMCPHNFSVSQDHLEELGLTLGPRSILAATCSVEQHRRETLLHHHQAAAASHDSSRLEGWASVSEPGSRSCSESLLAAYAEYEQNYGRSVETLAEASALVSPSSQMAKLNKQNYQKASAEHQHPTSATTTVITSSTVQPSDRQSGQQVAEPQMRQLKEEQVVGYKSYSNSFTKTGHLLHQATSFREPSYNGPLFNWSPGSRRDSAGGLAQSTPALSTSEEETTQLWDDREVISTVSLTQEVVRRQKPAAGRWTPVQTLLHPFNTAPIESAEPPGLTSSCGTPLPVPGGGPTHRANGSLAQYPIDSGSSIPFIDEPASPKTDHQACYVPACSVVSSSLASNMASLSSTSVPPYLSICPFVRLHSQDCSGIKGRRSSYLLAITTERSKSCDEGLNTFRDEGRVFSKLPKRVKSFFTDGSLESLRAQEVAWSKRHSTSELGTITFSDVRKEGWLHYKQILTEKGKKVGGSMRPWKRAFTVLRSHSLFLYRDKREAVLHGAGAGYSQDEYSPVSIRGCLIDIAYSETKRKHTLRLTTQDFCEYLLQAEDRDDMLAWIRIIRENSKTENEEIGFSRQALINKKLNDYRKHSLTGNKPDSSPRAHRMMPPFLLAKTDNISVKRASRSDDKAQWGINIMKKAKKTGSPKAFGVRLEDCQPAVNHKFVPLTVEMCCGVVETTGLEYTGIYRVPGNNAMVSNLQEHLDRGMDINTAEERWQDVNVISSLLKSFFRKLPEPLFTDDKYNDFIDANRIEDGEDRLKTMKKLIHDLPDHYYHTLEFLVGHLKRVADHSKKNKMEPRNLALVFGPTLVRTSEDNMIDMVTHMPDRYKIVETLILHYDWFFSDGELDKDKKTPEDRQDMQPLPNIDHLLSSIGRPGMPGEASDVLPNRKAFCLQCDPLLNLLVASSGSALLPPPFSLSDSTTSNSVKSKISLGSRKDLNARDFFPRAIISAVTRKRKICLSTHLPGSSADEDSEHEPVKATNYVVEEVGREKEEARREKEPVKGVHVSPKKEKRRDKEILAEVEKDTKNEVDSSANNFQRESGQRATSPAQHLPPNSYLNSYHHVQATCPFSHLRNRNQAIGRPSIPFWIYPTRPPNLYQAVSCHGPQQPGWSQSASVCYNKSRGGRMRALSMNLDLELDRSEERVKGWRADKVEVIRVTEGVPAQCGYIGISHESIVDPGSVQQIDPLPHNTQKSAPLFCTSPGWIDQSPQGSSTMVLRRLARDPRDKARAWRRHTMLV